MFFSLLIPARSRCVHLPLVNLIFLTSSSKYGIMITPFVGKAMSYKKQLWQTVKFRLFSIFAGIVQIGSFALLELFIKEYWIPYLISSVLSILWNFTLNRRYPFKSAANVPAAHSVVVTDSDPHPYHLAVIFSVIISYSFQLFNKRRGFILKKLRKQCGLNLNLRKMKLILRSLVLHRILCYNTIV